MRLGILFDIAALDGGLYGYKAYKVLFQEVDLARLAGCALLDGDTNATLCGRRNDYCIAVDAPSAAQLDAIREALARSTCPGLLPIGERFMDDASLAREPLVLSARVTPAGDLIQYGGWVREAWEAASERRLPPAVPDRTPEPQDGGTNGADSDATPAPEVTALATVPARRRPLVVIAGVVAAVLVLALLAAFTLGPLRAPRTEAGIGVPLSQNGWRVTITGARVEDRLKTMQGTFKANSGYKFLVVDYVVNATDASAGEFGMYGLASSETGENYGSGLIGFPFGNQLVFFQTQKDSVMVAHGEQLIDAPWEGSLVFGVPDVVAYASYRIRFRDTPDRTFVVQASHLPQRSASDRPVVGP